MREIPKPYERYHHFKGNDYQILAVAKSADDLRDMVVYQGLYEPYQIYVRDLEEFLSPVDKTKYPGASQEERFRRITEGTAEAGKTAECGRGKVPETEPAVGMRTVKADPAAEPYADPADQTAREQDPSRPLKRDCTAGSGAYRAMCRG